MGAHLSPCGRYLAACVACVLPHLEADPGLQTQVQDMIGSSTSPTRHPVSAHHVMYELRIYSLEEATYASDPLSNFVMHSNLLQYILMPCSFCLSNAYSTCTVLVRYLLPERLELLIV